MSIYQLPPDLPAPVDDGACEPPPGATMPARVLDSSRGPFDHAAASAERLVLCVYPRTGMPGKPTPEGWDAIPGARGCTPQSCAFRDHAAELDGLGARVTGLSAQTLEEQLEFAEREPVPSPTVAGPELRLGAALGPPTFELGGVTLDERVTLIVEGGEIVRVFYPVFPPDRNAADVVAW